MQIRQRTYAFFYKQAHDTQVHRYFQPAIISLYLAAIVFADEHQRVELWQQVGVNTTRLSHGALKKFFGTLANWCFTRALLHGSVRQKGAIRRDKAELLSKLGRFEEAQREIRLSTKLLLKTKDTAGLRLTRIIRAVVYCRWAVSLPAGSKRSALLCGAFEGLERVLSDTNSPNSSDHQNMIAGLWMADICTELYLDEREADWLYRAEEASRSSLRLVSKGAGSPAHTSRARAQIKTIQGLRRETA